MKKSVIVFMAAMLLCFTSINYFVDTAAAAVKTSADFADLKDLDAATKAKFDALISAGVFDGVEDNNFGAKDEMNRAQFAKVAALIFGLKVDASIQTSSFSDVKADDPANGYALPYIEAAKAAGITDGVADGAYDPAGKVTKEQLAAFLVKGLGLKDQAHNAGPVHDDTVSDWAKGYVALALEKKIMSNGADGTFGGTTNASRDLLVLGAYEAKTQYRSTGNLYVSVKQTGVKKIEVSFNAYVDSAKVGLTATKVDLSAANTEVVQVDWNDDNSAAALIFANKLEPGDYVIKATGLDVDDPNKLTAGVTVIPEKTTKIEFTSTSDTIARSKAVAIPFQALNQFGERVEDLSKIEVRSSIGSASFDPIRMAVIADTSLEERNVRAAITVLNIDDGVQANKIFTVEDAPLANNLELYGLRDMNGQEVSQVERGKSYYVNFDAYDQYGNIMLQPVAAVLNSITIASQNSYIASLGTVEAASTSDPGAFSFSVTLRSNAGDSPNNDSITITANGSGRMYSISLNIAAPPPAVVTPIVDTSSSRVVAKPTADRSSGIVESGTSVALTVATQGATIYYTTDGNTPTINSTSYSSPITITESATIKAIAVKSGWTKSLVASFEYTIPIELPQWIESTSSLVVGQAYSGSIAASGGTGDITYTVTNGHLPPGLVLDSNKGKITGTPTSGGTYSFTISATDSAATPATASVQYMMTIAPPAPTLTHLTSNPADVTLTAVGETRALAITASFSDNTSINVTGEAQFESTNVSVAAVTAQGVVTATANGTANIVVSYGGLTKNVPVTVTIAPPAPTLTQLTSDPAAITLTAVGETRTLAITASFSDNTSINVTGEAQFASTNVSVAAVSAQGVVTAATNGTVNIIVSYGGLTKNVPVTVTIAPPAPTLTQLTSDPANVMFTSVGATRALAITASFSDNTSLNVTGEVQYESDNESVATVSAQGVVKAVANGTANIVVSYGGSTKNVPVMVTAARQLESIYASLSSVSLAVGMTANVTVSAFFDDESAEGATAWATFEVEDPDVATIDANGYLTALKPGKTKIKVTFLSKEFITDELIVWE